VRKVIRGEKAKTSVKAFWLVHTVFSKQKGKAQKTNHPDMVNSQLTITKYGDMLYKKITYIDMLFLAR
jgi:hypothetical protein